MSPRTLLKDLQRGPWENTKLGTLESFTEIMKLQPSLMGFSGASDSKESACSAGDLGSIPASGRSPGKGNGYPLQYSCLENSMD